MLKPGKKFYRRPSLTAAVSLLLVAFLIGPTAIVLTGRAQARDATTGGEKRAQTLHEAARLGDVERVKQLLSEGADVNEKDKGGRTPLHWAAWHGRQEVVQVLVAKGVRINETDSSGQTPLHLAASFGTKFVPELLLAQGANINARDNAGNTPLHITAGDRFWRGELLELLIAKGADLKARNEAGQTPLHYGARRGGGSALSLLIDHGADIDANDDILVWACTHGRKDLAELLVKKGANVNCKDRWDNPLPLAVIFSGLYGGAKTMDVLAILKLLLEHGADPNAGDRWDWSLLHYACGRGTELPRLLLDKGANPNVVENEAGLTPLHLAADKGNKEVVELLLSRGAKMNARDYNGRTPLVCAGYFGEKDIFGRPRTAALTEDAKAAKKEVATLLRKHGAKE